MTLVLKIDKTLRERRRISRLLDFLKRDDLTGEQMERIGRRLQKSGKRALSPLVRKLWREQNGTTLYRYTCMLDFFDASAWMDQLIQITLKRKDLEEDGKLALLDVLHDSGIDVTAPPFAAMTGYGSPTLEGFVDDCLSDNERGLVRFIDSFLDVADEFRERMMHHLADNASAEAVALLEILLSFEKQEIVREAIRALGRTKSGYALEVLGRVKVRFEGDMAAMVRRSILRLSFTGIRDAIELPHSFQQPLPFFEVYAGPVDFYGSRTLWFSWQLDDQAFAAMLILTGEADGMLNAISYRMKDEKEYGHILKDVAGGEMLIPVEPDYALASLRDALHRSREGGFYLPPDFYVDMRLFRPDTLKPEAYIPRFKLKHLEDIVEKIPGYVATSNDLLDEPGLEGWLLTEMALYDAADRFNALEKESGSGTMPPEALESEISRCCDELIVPRRADIIKRLLLTADYLQQIEGDESAVQKTLATALSLVGGFLPDCRHPFVRRLLLDSVDAARQTWPRDMTRVWRKVLMTMNTMINPTTDGTINLTTDLSTGIERIAVIGAGSWGTALAGRLAANGNDTVLWAFEPEVVTEINSSHTNSAYLHGINLHPTLACTGNLEEAVTGRSILLLVTPVQVMRGVLKQLAPYIAPDAIIANASKGIELETLKTVSQICGELLGDSALARYVALSGPTFAREVAQELPSLIVAASRNPVASHRVQAAFSCPCLRVYTNSDVTGVELGGAVKNVIAIAAGICDGLGFGNNARAALITRGLAEMNRLGQAMGAQDATFAGLAGMGDLVLTCTGDLSRNRTVGFKLGQGMKLADILAEMRMVAEGVKSAESVYQLARRLGVEMPIIEKTYQILHEDKPARQAVIELMARDLKAEG